MSTPINLSSELNHYLFAKTDEDQINEIPFANDQDLRILATWLQTFEGTKWLQTHPSFPKKLIRSIKNLPECSAIHSICKTLFLPLDQQGLSLLHRKPKYALACPSFFNNPEAIKLLTYAPPNHTTLSDQLFSYIKSLVAKDPLNPILDVCYQFLPNFSDSLSELHEIVLDSIKEKKPISHFIQNNLMWAIFCSNLVKSMVILLKQGNISELNLLLHERTVIRIINQLIKIDAEVKTIINAYFLSKVSVESLPLQTCYLKLLFFIDHPRTRSLLVQETQERQNIFHIMLNEQEPDLEFIELLAKKYPDDFDRLIFHNDDQNRDPIYLAKIRNLSTFFPKIFSLRKSLFTTPDDHGFTYLHFNIFCIFNHPDLFEDPESRKILFVESAAGSLFSLMINDSFEETLETFSFLENELFNAIKEKIVINHQDPALDSPALRSFIDKANKNRLKELIDIAIEKNCFIFINCLLSKESYQELFFYLLKDREKNAKFCRMLLMNNAFSILDHWQGTDRKSILEIIKSIIRENPNSNVDMAISKYWNKNDIEEKKEVLKLAFEYDNRSALAGIFYFNPKLFHLPEFNIKAIQNKFIRLYNKTFVRLLICRSNLEAIAYLMPLVPRLVIEVLSDYTYFFYIDVHTRTEVDVIKFLREYPCALREILLAKNKPIEPYFSVEKLVSLLIRHAPDVWETTDYGGRNLLHALAETNPKTLEFAIGQTELAYLKEKMDETGRTPIQVCFEKFPEYFMEKQDKTMAVNGFLFQNRLNKKSFLHCATNLKDLDKLKKIVRFLKNHNLIDTVMHLEDSKKRKPYYYIFYNLEYNVIELSHYWILEDIAGDLGIKAFLSNDDPQNVDLIYELILDKSKPEQHVTDIIDNNSRNFEEAIQKFIKNRNFPFSPKTNNLLFTTLKARYPKEYTILLHTIPHLKKGQVEDFLNMLFMDAPNAINQIASVIGIESLRSVIRKKSYSFFQQYKKKLVAIEPGSQRNFSLLIYGTLPEIRIYSNIVHNVSLFTLLYIQNDFIKELLRESILPSFPYIDQLFEEYNLHIDLKKPIAFNALVYANIEEFCQQEDPLTNALVLGDKFLCELVCEKIGLEATLQSITQIKKWFSLPLPVNENIFYLYDPSHLQVESIDPDIQAYIEQIDPAQLLDLFDKINFEDSSDINYYDPNKLKDDVGKEYVLVTPAEARESLVQLINNIKEMKPSFGTPPAESELLNTYYAQLSSLVKQVIYQIEEQEKAFADATPQERRDCAIECNDAVVTLAIAGLHCGGRWVGDALLTLELLKKEQLDLAKTLLRIQAAHRLKIAEQLAYESPYRGNVHALNTILILLGNEFKIPGYEYVIDHLTVNFDANKLRENFLKLYNPHTIVENIMQKINEKEIYKNMVMQWLKQNSGDYQKENYARKLGALMADSQWQDLVRSRAEGKLTEEALNVLAFLDYVAGGEMGEVEELEFRLPSLIKRWVVVPEYIVDRNERMNYPAKIVGQVLAEKKMIMEFCGSTGDWENQKAIRDRWIESKGQEEFVNAIQSCFMEKGVVIEKETIRMLLQERDLDRRLEKFRSKIEELLERQRSDEYLNEVLEEVGINDEDEPVYDFKRIKVLEMLTSMGILKRKIDSSHK